MAGEVTRCATLSSFRDTADDRLSRPNTRIESRFVRKPTVSIRPEQLNHAEIESAMPRDPRGEERRMSRHVDRGEHAAQVVVEQTNERGVDRNSHALIQLSGDHVEQTTDRDRGEAEHHHFGKIETLRKPDGVGVTGNWRGRTHVGGHGLERPAFRFDHPVDLFGVRNSEVRQLRR